MTKRTWTILGACAAGAIAFNLWADRGDVKRVRPEAEPREEAALAPREPDRARPALADARGRQPRERHDAPVVNGVVQVGPISRGKAAPATAAEPRSGAAWATSYAAAMCDCRTRACAADLQGDFIRAMGGVEYDEARDGAAYDEAIKHAIGCYFALPEGS